MDLGNIDREENKCVKTTPANRSQEWFFVYKKLWQLASTFDVVFGSLKSIRPCM